MSLANFGEPATLVRSPIMMKTPICCVNGCEPERRSGRGPAPAPVAGDSTRRCFRAARVGGQSRRRMPCFERLRDRRDVLGRVAAAAAGDVDQPAVRELAEEAAMSAGSRSKPVGDSGLGKPAFG
jgi:hypothetical protein